MVSTLAFFQGTFNALIGIAFMLGGWAIIAYLFYRFGSKAFVATCFLIGISMWQTDLYGFPIEAFKLPFPLTDSQQYLWQISIFSILPATVASLFGRNFLRVWCCSFILTSGSWMLFIPMSVQGFWKEFFEERKNTSKVWKLLSRDEYSQNGKTTENKFKFKDKHFIETVLKPRFENNPAESKWFSQQNTNQKNSYLWILYEAENTSGYETLLALESSNIPFLSPEYREVRDKNMRRYGLHLWGDEFIKFHEPSL